MSPEGKSREEMTMEANVVRSKLLHTVEQLDQRRHEALNLGHQLRTHAGQLAVVAGVAVLATAAVVGLVAGAIATMSDRRWRKNRWKFAPKGSRSVDLSRPKRRSFFVDVLRSLALSLIATALAPPARRLLAKLTELPATPSTPAPIRVDATR
jgi:hypothetical protein